MKIRDCFQNFFNKRAWSLSVQPEGEKVHWALLEEKKEGPFLKAYGTDTSLESALKEVSHLNSDSIYFSSIFPALSTLCRQLSLPKLPQKEFDSAILDSLEQSLPVEMQTATFAFESTTNAQGNLTISTYITQADAIRAHVAKIQDLGIDPEQVLPKSACLAAFIRFFQIRNWSYIIDVSEYETSVSLVFDGRAVESRALIGGMDLFRCIHQQTNTTDKQVYQLLQHVGETVFAFQSRYELEDVPCTITGEILSLPSAVQTIAEFINTPLSPLHSTEDLEILKYASTIGAAHLCLPSPNAQSVPNLRSRDLPFPQPLLHWKRPLSVLLAAAVCISGIFCWYGSSRTRTIAEEMNRAWQRFSRSSENTSLSPDSLLCEARSLLTKLENRSLFPLQPDVPRLSDCICWLSSQIEEIEKALPQETNSLFVQSLHYRLIKRPTKKNPREKYRVRIDLELSSSSVALARAFHERLIAQNDFVDPTSEVSWTAMNGKYRTNFLLKDKTSYPPVQT